MSSNKLPTATLISVTLPTLSSVITPPLPHCTVQPNTSLSLPILTTLTVRVQHNLVFEQQAGHDLDHLLDADGGEQLPDRVLEDGQLGHGGPLEDGVGAEQRQTHAAARRRHRHAEQQLTDVRLQRQAAARRPRVPARETERAGWSACTGESTSASCTTQTCGSAIIIRYSNR